MTISTTLHYRVAYVLAFFVYTLFSPSAHATVGGPTYIGSFTYNKADESVYFIENSQSGRGCPPMLKKISLISETVATAFSCDQGEALQQSGISYTKVELKVLEGISKLTTGFTDLTPLNLLKNTIQVDVKFVDSESLKSEPTWILKSHFTATVYQNGIKIDEFPIEGCDTEQPFTFAGYAIPGFEKKIILLSSTKGDCFEGGYTAEKLHVAGGITLIDSSYASNQYKSANIPLTPNEATLVIYEPDTTSSTRLETDTTKKYGVTVLGTLLAFVVGIYVGKMYIKRR